jgi:uncharacterized RDD family membrane protein YckC
MKKCFDPGSKRHFYHDESQNVVSWAHPDSPDLDVFAEEIKQRNTPLMRVPADAPAPPLVRRLGAAALDAGASLLVGGAFAGAVYVDLGDAQASVVAFSFALWASFVTRDAVIERGTRSLGKRAMKIEVVRTDGQLPNRYHTVMRNAYFIVYGGATAAGEFAPALLALAGGDLLLMLMSPGKRKIGDWIGGTRLVEEQDDRAERLREKRKIVEKDERMF